MKQHKKEEAMKGRCKRILLLLSALIVMALAAVSTKADEVSFIHKGNPPMGAAKSGEEAVAKAPVKPRINSLYNSNNGVGIKIKYRSGVYYYEIYRYEPGKKTEYIGWVYGSDTHVIDDTVKSSWGKSFVYSVYAFDYNYNVSRVSNKPRIVRIPGVTVTSKKAKSTSAVQIKWKPSASCRKITGYRIEYAKTKNDLRNKKGSFRKITLNRASARSVSLYKLSANTTYYFRIRAFYRYRHNGVLKTNYSAYTAFKTVKTKAKKTYKYRALVIGNSNYWSATDLEGPKNDANAMGRALRNYRYTTTVKKDLTKAQILSSIKSTFKNANSSDVSLFFYAGHGGYNRYTGRAFLAGVDSGCLYMNELASALKKIPGKVIVVLDSCYGGNAVFKGTDPAETGDFDPQAYNQSVVDLFAAADSGLEVIEDGEEAAKNGELRSSKFLVLTGGGKGESTYEKRINGVIAGVFSYAFISGAGCSYPGGSYSGRMPADYNYDRKITLAEMYSYARSRVLQLERYQHVACYPSGSGSWIIKK